MMMLAGGMFEKERNISVLYAAANLATSLLLVKPMGIAGVLLGTSVSYITQIVCRIYFFFRYYLQKNSAEYIGDMVQYGVLITMETIGVFHVVGRIYDGRSPTDTGNIGLCYSAQHRQSASFYEKLASAEHCPHGERIYPLIGTDGSRRGIGACQYAKWHGRYYGDQSI